MARFDFGGTLADFVVTSRRLGGLDTLALSSATLTFWSAQSGGTKYTDLQLNGSAVSSIAVGTDGQVPKFQGPDGVTEMWVDGGSPRVRVVTLQGAPGPVGPQGAASTVPGPTGPTGSQGPQGLPGVNGVANDTATAGYIGSAGSATQTAADARYRGRSGARPVGQDELVYNVLDHGVVAATTYAGATTDQTAAINALIASVADGGTIYFPAGFYRVGNLAEITKTVHLVGAGANFGLQATYGSAQWTSPTQGSVGGTVLISTATTGNVVKIKAVTAARNSSIENLSIVGPGTGTSKGLVLGENADASQLIRARVRNVNIGNFSTGFSSCAENSTIEGLFVVGCDTGFFTENAFNGNAIVGLDIEGCTTYACRLTNSDCNVFLGGVMQSNSGTVISLESFAYANTFKGFYFENATATHSIDVGVVAQADNNSFEGCHFQTTAPAIRIAGNHTRFMSCESTPPITLTGNYSQLMGTFASAVTDTGSSNVRIDSANGNVRFGDSDVRIGSGKRFYFETVGSNSYIGRAATGGNTEIGSGGTVVVPAAGKIFRDGSGPTASRPTAANAGAGGSYYDTDLKKLVLSDGTNWNDSLGGSPASSYAPAGGSSASPDALVAGEMVPPRERISSSQIGTASGVVYLDYFTAVQSETISNLTVSTGTVAAAATPTVCRLGLYTVDASGNLALVASTANDTTLFSTINTAYTKALTTPYSKVAGQRYAVALLVVSAAAMPNFHGIQMPATNWMTSLSRLSPAITGRVTGQTDLPASVAVGSVIGVQSIFAAMLS